MKGMDGNFSLLINDLNQRFYKRYELNILGKVLPASDDGIIEPGEVLYIPSIRYQNIGEMPTPIYQPIALYLQNTQWVYFHQADTLFTKGSIGGGQIWQLLDPMKFTIVQNKQPTFDCPFQVSADIDYRARVTRVEQEMDTVQNQHDILEVRYPVQISKAFSARSITIKEEAPFTIGVQNISTKPIGIRNGRLLKLTMQYQSGVQDIEFIRKTEFDDREDEEAGQTRVSSYYGQQRKIQKDIQMLYPGKMMCLSGTIRFTNPDLPQYSKSSLNINLDLGSIENPAEEYQRIQVSTLTIQLAESYTYNKFSEFLLVVNHQTEMKEIDAWQLMATRLGTSVDIWNISNYGGFSFDYKPNNAEEQFQTLLKNKVVIFLNNTIVDQKNKATCVMTLLGEGEIFEAANLYKIASYVVGPQQNFNILKNMYPFSGYIPDVDFSSLQDLAKQMQDDKKEKRKNKGKQDMSQTSQTLRSQEEKVRQSFIIESQYKYFNIPQFIKQYVCCSEPKPDSLLRAANSVSAQMSLRFPNRQNIVIYENQKKVLQEGTFSKKINLGSMQVRIGLPKNRAFIANRQKHNNNLKNVDRCDNYIMFKLLSFSKKIIYLPQLFKPENADLMELMIQAIISDLMDEFIAFTKGDSRQFNKPHQLEAEMQHWQIFSVFGMSFYEDLGLETSQEGITESDVNIAMERISFHLMHFHYFFKIYPSFCQKYCFCCCSGTVSQVSQFCRKTIVKILNKNLKIPKDKIKTFKKETETKNMEVPQLNVLNTLINPHLLFIGVNPGVIMFNNSDNNQFQTVYSTEEQPMLNPGQNNIEEGQFQFNNSIIGEIDQNSRIGKIEDYERQIQFQK